MFGWTTFGWTNITRFGEAGIVLPMAALGAVVIASRFGARAMLRAGIAPLVIAIALSLATKIAFLGFGIGNARWDFTGVSGHATLSAAVYPVLMFVLLPARPPWGRIVGVVLAYGFAAAIALSRVQLHVHSWSEAFTGLINGTAASAIAIAWLSRRDVRTSPAPTARLAMLAVCAWVAVMPHRTPWLRAHDLVTRLALQVSGRSTPYTRGDLHRGIAPAPISTLAPTLLMLAVGASDAPMPDKETSHERNDPASWRMAVVVPVVCRRVRDLPVAALL